MFTRLLLTITLMCGAGVLRAQDEPQIPEGTVGVPYYFSYGEDLELEAGDEETYFVFTYASGTLPPGITVKPSGEISGTPTQAGFFIFNVNFQGGIVGFPPIVNFPFPVLITIRASGGAVLGVSPTTVTLALPQGAPATTRPIGLLNQGAVVTYTASARMNSGQGWLSVSPASGDVPPFADRAVMANIDASRLAPGSYSGVVTIQYASNPPRSFDVPVQLTVSAGAQSIQLSQTGLRFQFVQTGGTTPAQQIQVVGGAPGALSFNVTAATESGGAWLSATPGTGTAPSGATATVNVNVNPTGLAPGDYYGELRFTSAGADNSPQTATVVLNVRPADTIVSASVLPAGLIFVARANGANPAAKTITVRNPGPTPLTGSVSRSFETGSNWFTVVPNDGVVTSAQPANLAVQINTAGLTANVYRGEIKLAFDENNDVQRVRVVLVVLPPLPGDARSAVGCTPTRLVPVFTLLGVGFSNPAGWPSAVSVSVVDDCGDPMTGGNVQASFSNGDAPLALLSLKDGSWSGTWQPQNVRSQVTVTVTAQQTTPALAGKEVIGGELQANPSVPTITGGGVVSAASYTAGQPLSPGSFIAVFGGGLSTGLTVAPSAPFPLQLGATQAILGGRDMPLYFTADGQVNAIVPYDVPINTTQQLVILNGTALSVPQAVVIAAAQPAVFTQNARGDGLGAIVAVKPDGSGFVIDATHRTTAGDVLVIYCTGLGAVDPPVPAGAAATGLSFTTNPVTVTVGGVPATVVFSGLAPGYPGLYQINASMPAGVAPGDAVPVIVTAAGQSSSPVTITVQ